MYDLNQDLVDAGGDKVLLAKALAKGKINQAMLMLVPDYTTDKALAIQLIVDMANELAEEIII
jgi:hypothetical protein